MGWARLSRRRIAAEIQYLFTGRPPGYLDPFRSLRAAPGSVGAVIASEPLVIVTAAEDVELPLGLGTRWGPRLADRDVLFLLHQYWWIEHRRRAWELVQRIRFYRRRFPRHRVALLANTEAEAELFKSFGADSFVAHHNLCLDENVFRPLAGAVRDFDAVMNARMTPFKRHFLAHEIPSLALVFGRDRTLTPEEELAHFRSVRSILPQAEFVNGTGEDAGTWRMLPSSEVNAWLNRAHVGLCLSVEEGGMYASSEYLLAGIGVVSTRSRGGRDRFFDQADCIICEDDPRSVAEAVAALKARSIPPAAIRGRVLKQIERERTAYEAALQELVERLWPRASVKLHMAQIREVPRTRPFREIDEELENALARRPFERSD